MKGAGAQYVLPVAKHHDGFCLWDAADTSPNWNAVEVGPRRDVLTELYNASQAGGLNFGIYYSQGEWFDADFVADSRTGFKTRTFVKKKVVPQRLDLVKRYPKSIIWHTDGGQVSLYGSEPAPATALTLPPETSQLDGARRILG